MKLKLRRLKKTDCTVPLVTMKCVIGDISLKITPHNLFQVGYECLQVCLFVLVSIFTYLYFLSVFLDKKDEEDDDIVNTNEAYCSVVRTRLNKHSILIGAEVDCCLMNNSQKPPANYIELKTTRIMYKFKQKANFARYKLLKFWAQSFLAGIPKIVVGMRNDDGVVSQITSYETLNIPHVSKQHSNEWDASVCMNFLDALLTWLKEEVTQEGPDIVYMIHFEYPFEKISIKLVDDGSERFLPDWFVSG